MPDESALLAALESLRDRGALGELSLPRAVGHSESFLAPIQATARRLIDLGSGGGLPGLVIADRRPGLTILLTDRRERRGDLLRLACARLGFQDRVSVFIGDVTRLANDPASIGAFDVVTARAFGDPLWTLRCARPFLSPVGVVIVSEAPGAARQTRWPDGDVRALGLRPADADEFPFVRCFQLSDVGC
jgi:16S rRNA (guanine527-N7)-methyltransferase